MDTANESHSDTSRSSFYVDEAFYGELDQMVSVFNDDWPDAGPQVVHEASWLLTQEARRLDEHRFDDWLELYTKDCLYWVPVARGASDPRQTISHAFDDRRRLEDRVFWLNTGLAYSQLPPSRTARTIANVEVRETNSTTRLVRSTFTVHEYRTTSPRAFSGWTAHCLTWTDSGWRIRVKQVHLLDSDAGHENLTIVL